MEPVSAGVQTPSKHHVIAATPMSFGGFDLWIGYRYLQRAGIRHVEVPALPMSLGAKFDLTTFAPEAMDQDAVNLFKQRLQTMALTPSTALYFVICGMLLRQKPSGGGSFSPSNSERVM